MFWRPKPSVPKAAVSADPLAAIPLKPENVEIKPDSQGRLHLRLTPPLKPFHRKIAEWLHYDYTRKIELDEYGSTYYRLVDGQRPLSAIVDELAKKLGKEHQEVAMMVVTYTKMLMTRNMLALKVARPGGRS